LAQFLHFLLTRLAFHLDQIGFGKFVPWIADACLQGAVIGQQQQAFRIPVQSTGRVYAGHRHALVQCSPALVVAELGEDLKRFVK
jgi:hypothetical protein